MAFAKPAYPRNQVDRAGVLIGMAEISPDDRDWALNVINNWRAAHACPLNTFQMNLRNKVKALESTITIAQRTKRLASIVSKLSRQPTLQLSQMQDIAGCRAVVRTQRHVTRLRELFAQSKFEHTLRGEKDYITEPKADGYRSHHLIYQYKGRGENAVYDRLRIEIQLRTISQHAWATAVEAVGAFTNQALKSNQGTDDWKRFFALMSTVIATRERTAPVPNTPFVGPDLRDELSALEKKLQVGHILAAYRSTLNYAGERKKDKETKYFIVRVNIASRQVYVTPYKLSESQKANYDYTVLEAKLDPTVTQVVLVSVDSLAGLRRAYPNYFLDTTRFYDIMMSALKLKAED